MQQTEFAQVLQSRTTGAGGEAEPLLSAVTLFDLFDGKGAEQIGVGRKSLAYSLTYLDRNRTLTSDEVSAAHDRIRERLKGELGVELRE